MKREVILLGPLGERFTSEPFDLVADDWHGLLAGLQSRFKIFRRVLSEFDDIAVLLRNGEQFKSLTQETLRWKFGNYKTIYISVGTRGSTGVETAIISYMYTAGASWAAATATAAFIVSVAVSIAVSVVTSAVMKALADSPPGAEPEKARNASNLFQGAANTVIGGGACPVVVGTFTVGSTTVSSQVTAEKQSIAMADTINTYVGGEPTTGNVFGNDVVAGTMSILSWTLSGQTFAPGATYSNAGVTFTLAANGDFIFSAPGDVGFSGAIEGTYTGTSENTAATTADLHLMVAIPDPGYSGGY